MKSKQFLITILLLLSLVFTLATNVKAAGSFNATISSSAVNVGDTFTVVVTATGAAGTYQVTFDSSKLSVVSGSTGDFLDNSSATITFKAISAGTVQITAKATDMTDNENDEVTISGSKTFPVTIKEVETPPAEIPDEPEDNNSTETPNEPQQPEENNPTDTPNEPGQPEENNPNEVTPPENNENNNENNKPQEPEQTFTDVNKTMYVKSDCTSLNLREGPNSLYNSIGALKTNEKVTVTAIGNKGWYKVKTESGKEGYVAGNYLTETEPEKEKESSVATLSNLTVSPGKLNETFSKNTLSYTMTVESDVDSITVTPTLADDKAEVTVKGNTGLTAGTGNEIIIKVVAEDGISTKTYKISVTKLATEDEDPNIIEEPRLGLSALSIEGIEISPEFKSTIYEYTAKVTDKTIEKLKVNATSTFEDSKIDITGADEIKDGENVITITVTSANGEETVTYQIIVEKKEPTVIAKVEPKEKEDSMKNIIIALVAAIAIVVLILIFILVKRKEKTQPVRVFEDGDYNEPEETYSKYLKNDNDEENIEYNQEDDDDDDWGTPKRGFINKFKKSGRHF